MAENAIILTLQPNYILTSLWAIITNESPNTAEQQEVFPGRRDIFTVKINELQIKLKSAVCSVTY